MELLLIPFFVLISSMIYYGIIKDPATKQITQRTTKIIESNKETTEEVAEDVDALIARQKAEKEAEDAKAMETWTQQFLELSMTPEERERLEAERQQKALEQRQQEEEERKHKLAQQYELEKSLAQAQSASAVNIREHPTPNSRVTATHQKYDMVNIVGWVKGVSINGNSIWLIDHTGGFIWSGVFSEMPRGLKEFSHYEADEYTIKDPSGKTLRQYTTPDPRTPEQIAEQARMELIAIQDYAVDVLHQINAPSTAKSLRDAAAEAVNKEQERHKKARGDYYRDASRQKYQENLYSSGGWIAPKETVFNVGEHNLDGMITADKINAGVIRADKITVGPQKTLIERLTDEFEHIYTETPTEESVRRMTEIADLVERLREQEAEQKERDRLKSQEDRIHRLERELRQTRSSYPVVTPTPYPNVTQHMNNVALGVAIGSMFN